MTGQTSTGRSPDFNVRRPRHDVRSTEHVNVWLAGDDAVPVKTPATLVDVSRHGCRLLAPCELEPQQAVHVVIELPVDEREAVATAEVRWKQSADSLHEYGLEFQPLLDWETLGELFITGALEP